MRLPQIGNIVLYNDGKQQQAAIVVGITMDKVGVIASTVNLKVFTDQPNGLLQYIRNVPQGDIVGTWQWPDIEIDR